MTTQKERELAFVEEVKKTLEEKGEKLDPEVLMKLASIRGGVVETRRGERFVWFWRMIRLPVAGLMVGAMCLVLAVFYYRPPASMQNSLSVIEDVAILVDEDTPDFYVDLDFYSWLAETDELL